MAQISVLIPTYNRLEVLKRAISSVENQTWADWDLWVIDDASTDGTAEWVRSKKLSNPQIHLVELSKNRGVSFARNQGISCSKGEWVALLDSDDEWLPKKLLLQMQAVQENPHLKFFHGEEIWIRNGIRVNPHKKHAKSGGQIFLNGLDMCRISPSSALIHRSLFEKYGTFREEFPVCEDYELWLRLCRHEEVGFITEPLLKKYGGHKDQLSQRYHSMDYWRLKALQPFLDDKKLEEESKTMLVEVVRKKAEILLKGYRKYQNFENYDEIRELYEKTYS
ncbi:MAG: glycosyltransferase [Bdellovibrionales bacterium]|nr:glycosyltransferase [Bdellovibrionales bacterium]